MARSGVCGVVMLFVIVGALAILGCGGGNSCAGGFDCLEVEPPAFPPCFPFCPPPSSDPETLLAAEPGHLQDRVFTFEDGIGLHDGLAGHMVTLMVDHFTADGDGDPERAPFTLTTEEHTASGTLTTLSPALGRHGHCTLHIELSSFPDNQGPQEGDDISRSCFVRRGDGRLSIGTGDLFSESTPPTLP